MGTHTFLYTKWLVGWLILCKIPVWGQSEQNFQTYLDQGHRYEEQSNYRKALDAYRKALPNATVATRPTVQQAISRVDELVQQQTLVIESQTQEIRKVAGIISSMTNRNRIQADLIALQKREDVTAADYKALLRKANALKKVETDIATSDDEVVIRPESRPTTTINRGNVKPTPALASPPPKTITSSMPGTLKEGTRSKMESKATKSL